MLRVPFLLKIFLCTILGLVVSSESSNDSMKDSRKNPCTPWHSKCCADYFLNPCLNPVNLPLNCGRLTGILYVDETGTLEAKFDDGCTILASYIRDNNGKQNN